MNKEKDSLDDMNKKWHLILQRYSTYVYIYIYMYIYLHKYIVSCIRRYKVIYKPGLQYAAFFSKCSRVFAKVRSMMARR